ncbi:hypothetical protein CFOL_v3_31833, partial [Cephalotus follicularis]
ISH